MNSRRTPLDPSHSNLEIQIKKPPNTLKIESKKIPKLGLNIPQSNPNTQEILIKLSDLEKRIEILENFLSNNFF